MLQVARTMSYLRDWLWRYTSYGFSILVGLKRSLFWLSSPRGGLSEIPYRSINSEKKEFRYLEILPSKEFDSPLELRLRHGVIGVTKYHALSYVWGSPKEQVVVNLEYQYPSGWTRSTESLCLRVAIGKNLESALRHIRDDTDTIEMWADAVSINQRNDDEKTQQINLMGEIYENASKVILWLGEENVDSTNAIKGLRDAANFFLDKEYYLPMDSNRVREKLGDKATWKDQQFDWDPVNPKDLAPLLDLILPKEGEGVFNHGVCGVFARDWWRRIWTIQELMLAKEAIFVCGRSMIMDYKLYIGFHILAGLNDYIINRGGLDNPNITKYERMVHVEISKINWQAIIMLNNRIVSKFGGIGKRRLHDLLSYVYVSPTPRLTSNDQDYVFGILGMVRSSSQIAVQYSLSVSQVFAETSKVLFQELISIEDESKRMEPGTELYFITWILPHLNKVRKDEILPSWAIDWTPGAMADRQLKPLPRYTDIPTADKRFRAASSRTPHLSFPVAMPHIMKIVGYSIGHILYAGPKFSEVGISADYAASTSIRARCYMETNWWIHTVGDVIQLFTPDRDLHADLEFVLLGKATENHTIVKRIAEADRRKWVDSTQLERDSLCSIVMWSARYFRIARIEGPYVGYVPEAAQDGDIVVLLWGVPTPMVMRMESPSKASSDLLEQRPLFKFVGPAIIPGIMFGEFLELKCIVEEEFLVI